MMTIGKDKRDLILAIVFGALFFVGGLTAFAVKWRENWRDTHVTHAETVAFADRMEKLYATGSRDQVRAMFFDNAILRNHLPGRERDIDLELYVLRFDDNRRPYKHTVESVEVSKDGLARLVLDCRMCMPPDRVTVYRKYITVQKRDGRIGIVKRERDLPTSRELANMPSGRAW
jgi:hypothetical protein